MTDGGSMAEMAPQERTMSVLPAEGVKAAQESGHPYAIPPATTGRLEITIPNPSTDPHVTRVTPFVKVDLGLVTTGDVLSGKFLGNATDHRAERPAKEPQHTVRLGLTPDKTGRAGDDGVDEDTALLLKGLFGDEAQLAKKGVNPANVARVDLVVGTSETLFPPSSEVPLLNHEGIHLKP